MRNFYFGAVRYFVTFVATGRVCLLGNINRLKCSDFDCLMCCCHMTAMCRTFQNNYDQRTRSLNLLFVILLRLFCAVGVLVIQNGLLFNISKVIEILEDSEI